MPVSSPSSSTRSPTPGRPATWTLARRPEGGRPAAGDAVGADTGVLADLAGAVDVVVANPPYIPDGARPVDPEVADHDPEFALYGGGADGLDVPRGVVSSARGLLRAGGLLVMEHGDAQGARARRLLDATDWNDVRTAEDLTGRPRALVARRR